MMILVVYNKDMKKLIFILIPAVMAFSLFFGLAGSGGHDAVFGTMDMRQGHMACDGVWCGWLPDVTCSVHCLTSGLLQSLAQPMVAVVPGLTLLALALALATITVEVLVPHWRPLVILPTGLPPPARALRSVVKRE